MSYAANPRAPSDGKEIQEGTGMVTSDSLAGESLKQGGSFAAGQNAAPSDQPSRSTTTNNTDTSGATTLSSARDADDRLTSSDLRREYQTPADGRRSGNTGGGDASYDTSSGDGQSSGLSGAPTAVGGTSGLTDEQGKPKGRNIQEGGFDSDAPNASFNNDIGTKNDPARDAEQNMLSGNARAPADAGYPNAQNSVGSEDQGGFESLHNQEEA